MAFIAHDTSKAPDTSEELAHNLGEAVVRIWSYLPHDVQYHLFEDVISHHGETMRRQLAGFLHDRHLRTYAGMKARAVVEPDSLGG
jgi:hypothetical protein